MKNEEDKGKEKVQKKRVSQKWVHVVEKNMPSPRAIFGLQLNITCGTVGLTNSCSGRVVNWAIPIVYQRVGFKDKDFKNCK